jgi:hypothetical protein
MAFSPRGNSLTTAEGTYREGTICHWDPRTGKRDKEFPQGQGWLESLSYSTDGKTLAFSHLGQQGSVFILCDPATGKERDPMSNPKNRGRNPALSPDGRLLVCRTEPNAVTLWDTKKAKLVRGFGKYNSRGLDMLRFSPDGRTIATPGGQGFEGNLPIEPDVVLWETATGRKRVQIPTKDGQVRQVAFAPDCRLLASVGRTETHRVWDTWTGKEVGQFTGHRGWMNSLSFSPDGKALASGGADGTILVWDVTGLLPASRKPAQKLGRNELTSFWDELAGPDAARAYRAMAKLAQRAGQAEGLLKDKLAAHLGLNSERLALLIADLDAEDFKTRERASKALAKFGRLAENALTKALEGKPSPEVERRVRNLMEKLERLAEDPEKLRLLRAIEVLERLGTREARQLLSKLDKGAAGADVAREAKASLERLQKAGKR